MRVHMRRRPYIGRVLLRFERSTLQQHAGTDTVVLRVLKIIEPIRTTDSNYDMRASVPVEGMLLEKLRRGVRGPISFDLNNLSNNMKDLGPFVNPSMPYIPPVPSVRPRRRVPVQTLDPRRLMPTDFVDVSNQKYVVLPITSPTSDINLLAGSTCLRFPPHSHGFLYYRREPSLPATTGEVRLRLTASNDPALFESGTDLVGRHGRPWGISLPQLLNSCNAPLKERLLLDKLVEPNFIRTLETSWANMRTGNKRAQTLHRLEDPFEVSLNKPLHVRLIAPHCTGPFSLPYLFKKSGNNYVYTGRMQVRFERSPLPEHVGTNTVVLRILKITEPIQALSPIAATCIKMPREGALFTYINRRMREECIFSLDLDNPKTKLLKLFARLV
ncbi:hypothetical protein H0H81_011352 [Sphagnurus paluster]|uniref:Uncharacterized protein n=1 Tax=Sphagnurus paluster TaxID=117069 RepID=A0A9P7FV08_9AGAR|nr:hypothetical protein H0H81_011352 [Sphagnurus paluster]